MPRAGIQPTSPSYRPSMLTTTPMGPVILSSLHWVFSHTSTPSAEHMHEQCGLKSGKIREEVHIFNEFLNFVLL